MRIRRCETGLGLRGRYKSAFYIQYCFFVDISNDSSISNYWCCSRMIRRIRQIEKGVIVFDLLYFQLQQNMPNSIYIQFPCLVKVKKPLQKPCTNNLAQSRIHLHCLTPLKSKIMKGCSFWQRMNNSTWIEAYWALLIRMNGTFILIIFYKEIIFPLGRSFFPLDKVSYWSGRALQIMLYCSNLV